MEELKVGHPARGTTTGRPILVLFDALGRRGALRLLWELRDGRRLTFRALVTACESNPGALNTRLRELRELHLVEHGGGGYHLTAHGLALVEALGPLNRWADQWAATSSPSH
ncbi:MAG TPA: transcriptional regulator [Marmoricola sp.]|nr:transcriptional regulator [Marmoricola sp.]